MLRSNLIPAEVKPLKVLLVEDNLSLAKLYVSFLQAEPVVLNHVATGQSAMDAIRAEKPSVVLLDLQLPDMNGIDILNWIQDDAIDTAVIVVTADGSLSTAVEAMKAGALDFLVKPFNKERLLITASQCVGTATPVCDRGKGQRRLSTRILLRFHRRVGLDAGCVSGHRFRGTEQGNRFHHGRKRNG